MERIRRSHRSHHFDELFVVPQESGLQRFGELLQAFVQLSESRDDVQLRGAVLPAPLGFAVRVQPGPTTAGVELVLGVECATLRHWGADGAEPTAERPFRVDLSEGYGYECLLFPDASSLAATLLHRLDDELGIRPANRGNWSP